MKSSSFCSKALFFDRDGVINLDHGYVHTQDRFDFIDGIFEVARVAKSFGFKWVVITNQAGIARGFYSEEQFQKLTDWMCKEFINASAPIERVYYSPFHPKAGLGGYKKDDYSRKPHPGMIFQAQRELSLDLSTSILIGDKITDIQAGIAAGVGTNILFSSKSPTKLMRKRYQIISNLREALLIMSCCHEISL